MAKPTAMHWIAIAGLSLCCTFSLGVYAAKNLSDNTLPTVFMAAWHPDSAPQETLSGHVVRRQDTRYTGSAPITIPLAKDERSLMLEATINRDETGLFILDTGATYTTISTAMALRLGYDLSRAPRVTITTANGQVSIPRITLKTLTIGNYTAHNVEATVMPMPKNVPFSGLLGLSFIKRQRVTIDSAAERLVIEPS